MNDFRAVLVVDPNNKAAKNQVVLTTQKIKKQHDTEKKLYSNLFRQMIQTESKVGRTRQFYNVLSSIIYQHNLVPKKLGCITEMWIAEARHIEGIEY